LIPRRESELIKGQIDWQMNDVKDDDFNYKGNEDPSVRSFARLPRMCLGEESVHGII
jgi:hypothetical protein